MKHLSKRKIGIIGAGFSGLGLCYHLCKSGKVGEITLFDRAGIGGGASGIASGLLHPYPGEEAKRSWMAKEGMEETCALLEVSTESLGIEVAKQSGILRLALTDKQKEKFQKRVEISDDMEWWDEYQTKSFIPGGGYNPGIFIRSGITVHSSLYLQGLWKACESLGAQFVKKELYSDEMEEFDQIVIAAGSGIQKFTECASLPIAFTKGQVLVCSLPHHLRDIESSLIGKGYLALSDNKDICYLGSTYERNYLTTEPCLGTATELIFSQMSQFIPCYSSFKVLGCLSDIRVINRKSYRPILGKLNTKLWVMTAMGSRGLLYHGYLGKKLCDALLDDNPSLIPAEVRI